MSLKSPVIVYGMGSSTSSGSSSGSRKSRSRKAKVRLSFLVLRYLQEGRLTYAVILALAAIRPVSRREMLQLAALLGEDLDVTTLKSWLHYQVLRGYLEKTGVQGMYRIGPVVEPDVDDVVRILQEYDINLEELNELLLRKGGYLQQLVQLLEQDPDIVEKLLDPDVRNIVRQVLQVLSGVSHVRFLYRVKCGDNTYTINVPDGTFLKIGDSVRLRDQECIVIGLVLQVI